MGLKSTLRRLFVRAVRRGDPRPGILVGAAVSIAVAAAFAADLGYARRAEHVVLDAAFRYRPPIPETDRILQVDIDDATTLELTWPLKRRYHQQLIASLDRLGARAIVFDVEFSNGVPRTGEFDERDGSPKVDADDRGLRAAVQDSGRVVLAYRFDAIDPLPQAVREHFPKFREILGKDIAAGAPEIAGRSGVPEDAFRDRLETLRYHVAIERSRELLEASPEASFEDLVAACLPNRSTAHLRLLQHAYRVGRSQEIVKRKAVRARVEGLPPGLRKVHAIYPPLYALAEGALGAGFVNTEHDEDGVIRRQWLLLHWNGIPHFYLGFVAGVLGLMGEDEEAEVIVRPREVEVRVAGKGGGTLRRSIVLPMDDEGRILVNWAGTARRKRGAREDYFDHLPFVQLISFYEDRYIHLDANVRKALAKFRETSEQPCHPEYEKLGDDWRKAMEGEGGENLDAARAIEGKLEEIRRKVLAECLREAAEAERGLAQLEGRAGADRLRVNLERHRDVYRRYAEAIQAPYDREAALRPRVAGRICLVGSAGTASGDLHSSPLGAATPGVDAHANVANMVITGKVLRAAPGWLNLLYLLAVGLGVTLAVTYWGAAGSTAFSAGVGVATGAFYGILFVGPGILVSGAGPLATTVFAFAAVITYKEVVTRRSKKKLQRELEKNTSAELVTILLEHPEFLDRPRKMSGTFFFSDIKTFTSISERMAPEVLVPFMNRYLDRMTRLLKARQAYLDKYIGDGIMALFGIPVPSPDHARNACRAALDCQKGLAVLNAELALQGMPRLQIRIGIHSGEAVAGYMGASDRSDYTVLGDAVNLAARLEGANKEYDTDILISEATLETVQGEFQVRELDKIRVMGRRGAVRIFELLAPAGAAPTLDPRFLEEYGAALARFKERRWAAAIEGFERALAVKPGDRPCETYLSRANAFQLTPPPPDWEGVFDLLSK